MGKKILVVDDSTIMRKMIGSTLHKAGHEVVGEAKDGNTAIEQYKLIKPDLVTMDITMRGMDGFTAAGKILDFDNQAQIIFLSNRHTACMQNAFTAIVEPYQAVAVIIQAMPLDITCKIRTNIGYLRSGNVFSKIRRVYANITNTQTRSTLFWVRPPGCL